jgi:hypothetical protein
MLFLRTVGRRTNHIILQCHTGATDRQPADFLRSGDVSIQQSRGQVSYRHIVEAVATFIGGQKRRSVDVQM